MQTLILVKHSLPEIAPELPAAQWTLGSEGRRRAMALAERLAPYQPTRILASIEPKAAETARIVAGRLGLVAETTAGLHEHERSRAGWQPDPAQFEAAVAALFARPDDLVYGDETARQARTRFAAAVDGLVAGYPQDRLVIVAHGTVISLLVAQRATIDGFGLWRRLGLPSFVVLELPAYHVVEVVEAVDAGGADRG